MANKNATSLALAHATMLEISAATFAYQGVIVRGAPPEEQEALRQRAHDLLDALLDRNAESARAALSILGR